jgi:hypothetical protein
MLNVQQLLVEELEYWEQLRQEATDHYNRATISIIALTQLTERMKQAVENEHQTDTSKGVEREVKTV